MDAKHGDVKDGWQEHEEEEEAFTLVTRKKNGRKTASAGAALQRAVGTPSTSLTDTTTTSTPLPGWSNTTASGKKKKKPSSRAQRYMPVEKTLEWGLNTIQERRSVLIESKFFQAFRDLVRLRLSPPCKTSSSEKTGSLDSHEQDQDPKTTADGDVRPEPTTTRPIVNSLVCYGIGSIEGSRNAQHQIALALELKEILEIQSNIYIFDPAMTRLDVEITKALDMHVLEKGEALPDSLTVDKTVLYFMPHCPKGLYSHVLEKNWTRQAMDHIVILGNRFSMYHESPNYRTIAKQAPFIFPALAIAEEYALPTIKFEDNTAFNDLAIHVFPSNRDLPEPDLTEREIDPEML
ncbi:hypothetical protein BGZ73_003860 [Actinomortierella ambigua]|nr:hypothetical protein BGZ73_003860 [Actinomortierella ambigua]